MTVVVEAALGSCAAEWWPIAEDLGTRFKVICYDRAGIGKSSRSTLSRTPKNIALELAGLLDCLGIDGETILVGHSQGGLYAVQFALDYLARVQGIVFLDPLTPYDDEFKTRLTPKEFHQSGVDKAINFKYGRVIAALGLGFLVRPLLKKSPPFFYHQYSQEAMKYMLSAITSFKQNDTALKEYRSSHELANIRQVKEAIKTRALGNLPVVLVTHEPETSIQDIQHYGGATRSTAEKIESLWEDLMSRYLAISSRANHVSAIHGGHFIHLTDQDLVEKMINQVAQSQ